jgi:hypothetical protein
LTEKRLSEEFKLYLMRTFIIFIAYVALLGPSCMGAQSLRHPLNDLRDDD